MNVTLEASLRNVTAFLAKAGAVPFPAAFTETIGHLDGVQASGSLLEGPAHLADLVTAALVAGTDPADDPAVDDALTRYQLARAMSWDLALKERREAELARILREWMPRLVAEWAALVGAAGKRLSSASRHLDTSAATLDEQSQTVLRLGGKSADSWHVAYTASVVIDNLTAAQLILIQALEHTPHAARAILACPAITYAEYRALPGETSMQGAVLVDAWGLTRAGHTITGCDHPAYEAACIRHNEEIAAAQKAEQIAEENLRRAAFMSR